MMAQLFDSAQLALKVSKDLPVTLECATSWNQLACILSIADGTDNPVHVSIGAFTQLLDLCERHIVAGWKMSVPAGLTLEIEGAR